MVGQHAGAAQEAHAYKAELPDSAAMLQEDKPLDEQPEVFAALTRAGLLHDEPNQITGRAFYELLSKELGGDRQASEALEQAGVPELEYPDHESLGAAMATSVASRLAAVMFKVASPALSSAMAAVGGRRTRRGC